MATTFEVFYLGQLASIDVNETDSQSERADDILGSYGTQGEPLFDRVQTFSRVSASSGSRPDAYDFQDANDRFAINGGAAQTVDGFAWYNAVITYADGSTALVDVGVVQDTAGNTYVVPPLEGDQANADTLQAQPIQSIQLTSTVNNAAVMHENRVPLEYGEQVDGTDGNDTIDNSTVDGMDDQAGSGNDVINAGAGDDVIYDGAGNDTIEGGGGNDTIVGADGDDLIIGDGGTDVDPSNIFHWADLEDPSGIPDDKVDNGDNVAGQPLGVEAGGVTMTLTAPTQSGSATTYSTDANSTANLYDASPNSSIHMTGTSDLSAMTRTLTFSEEIGNVSFNLSDIDNGNQVQVLAYDSANNPVAVSYTLGSALSESGGVVTGNGSNLAPSSEAGTATVSIAGPVARIEIVHLPVTANDLITVSDVYFDSPNATNVGNDVAGNDSLSGGAGDDTILGGDGDDTIDGGTGSDSIDAGAGQDYVIVSDFDGATEYMDGGAGTDWLVLNPGDGRSFNIDITATDGNGDWQVNDGLSGTQYARNFENIETGDGADTVTGDSANNVISTNGGADLVDGGTGDDTLFGGDGNDTLYGGLGNDELHGGNDNDTLYGGHGNDLLYGEGGNNSLDGGGGDDTLWNGAGNDIARGGDGNDLIHADQGSDALFGDGGDDVFSVDNVWGAFGSDTIEGGETDEVIGDQITFAGMNTGISVTFTGAEAGTFTDGTSTASFSEIERIEGSTFDDTIDAGNDTGGVSLSGGGGNDRIIGGSGADTIEGGAGDDLLTGGGGDDIFGYATGDGHDTITDFNFGNTGALGDDNIANNDFIDLSSYYDSASELRADYSDDGILNQSNATENGGGIDYTDNSRFGSTDSLTFQGASPNSFTADNTGVVCFAAGTLILRPKGEVPIETLRPGDMVVTRDNGQQPLVWVGMRRVTADELTRMPHLKPIEIKVGAFGNHSPLVVSPQHGILLSLDRDEKMVRAKHLSELHGGAVRIKKGCRTVTYFHLMFEQHQVVFSNGLPSESFFPGPQAVKALALPEYKELVSLFPQLGRTADKKSVSRIYGNPARIYLRRSNLPDTIREFRVS
tara:strand:- start:3192 stop:6431 length:3240 start_codon:yes stop_codon:yes gene_type:complete